MVAPEQVSNTDRLTQHMHEYTADQSPVGTYSWQGTTYFCTDEAALVRLEVYIRGPAVDQSGASVL